MLAHAIGGGRWWKVEAEPRRPATAEIGAGCGEAGQRRRFREEAREGRQAAPLGWGGRSLVAHDASGARTAEVFARLLDMTDAQVMQVLAAVMAETLAAGTDLIDTLGQQLKVDCLQHWRPDEPFFVLVKDREAVGGMLAEVIGETAANSYLTEPGTKKKAIIRKALAGEGRSKVEGWTPRYMAFPRGQYTGAAWPRGPRQRPDAPRLRPPFSCIGGRIWCWNIASHMSGSASEHLAPSKNCD